MHQKRPRSPGALFAYFRARDTQEGITACAASQAGGPHVPGLAYPGLFSSLCGTAGWENCILAGGFSGFSLENRYNGTRMRREGSLWWDAGSGGSGERAEDGARERRYDRVGSGRYKRLAGTAVSPAASPARNSGLGTGPAGAGVCGGAFGAADASGERIRGLPSADVPGRAGAGRRGLAGGMPVFLLGGRGSDGGELLAKGDYLEGYMLSEGINERIFQASEEVSRRAAREMARRGCGLSRRYSPGEGTLDLSCQKTLLEAFGDVPEVRGITLTPGLMLRPERSMLYVFGADPDYPRRSVEHDCGMCPREGCLYRRTGFGKMGTGTKTGPEERKCTEYAW